VQSKRTYLREKNKIPHECLKERKSRRLIETTDERWRVNNSWRLI